MKLNERAAVCLNPTTKRLLALMEEKKSNLVLSIDVTSQKQALFFADLLGEHIVCIKTHVDILTDFTSDFGGHLREIAEKRKFLIFEDRKFADIGNTVRLQYEGGIYQIAHWADIVNAHILPGPGIIDGLKMVGLERGRGLLLIGEMSSKGNFAKGEYTQKTVELAKANLDFVIGFISQRKLTDDPALLHMTPGISLEKSGDTLGQQYVTPYQAIVENGSDLLIVGRSIVEAKEPKKAALEYQLAGWQAYQKTI